MRRQADKSLRTGTFLVAPDYELKGNLSLNGQNTSLYVWDDKFFTVAPPLERTITGVLDDQTKVSLLGCIVSGSGSFRRESNSSHFYDIFPSYVIFGDQHLSEADEEISDISFVLDDAAILFGGTDAFGTIISHKETLQQVIDSENIGQEIALGDFPLIAYYTGENLIFSSDTAIGKITAHHAPSWDFGGANGAYIKNKILVNIKFNTPIAFSEALFRMQKALRFFELVVGRAQNLTKVTIGLGVDQEPRIDSEVYECMRRKSRREKTDFGPMVHDVLINAARNSGEFSSILATWLERDTTWATARAQFFSGWRERRSYYEDRIVGAANMFDILPEEVFSENSATLPQEMSLLVEKTKKEFKKLEGHPGRDSILGALGRVGKLTLKQKIHQRSEVLQRVIGDLIPDISAVINEAVNCRNFYVHGGIANIDYERERATLVFLTETLEFIFPASDLIDVGWDITGWLKTGGHPGHPFGLYLLGYMQNLQKFKAALGQS